MHGNVTNFNGTFGNIIGDDNQKYFLHKDHINTNIHGLNNAKRQLSKASPSNPIEVIFTPSKPDNDKKRPKALNVIITKSNTWQPQTTLDGFWIDETDKSPVAMTARWRCSSCGGTSDYLTKFCPHCGVPMNQRKDTSGYNRIRPDIRSYMSINLIQTRNINIPKTIVEDSLTKYLRYQLQNSPHLTCQLVKIKPFIPTTYGIELRNTEPEDDIIIKSFLDNPNDFKDKESIIIPWKTTQKLILEACLPEGYSVNVLPSNNEIISFSGTICQTIR